MRVGPDMLGSTVPSLQTRLLVKFQTGSGSIFLVTSLKPVLYKVPEGSTRENGQQHDTAVGDKQYCLAHLLVGAFPQRDLACIHP
ncbi:hypothetical protein OS493_033677 [Desmophyllum pertusum]|uniref:Uncharacterized protein n=1 Tax=Desmophyllum pertusum TaxID=174260 RepID=A0A9W9ZZX9_9CNID|nr:hypothetical protein OS493_033677 [Desmophyllum pertusum]